MSCILINNVSIITQVSTMFPCCSHCSLTTFLVLAKENDVEVIFPAGEPATDSHVFQKYGADLGKGAYRCNQRFFFSVNLCICGAARQEESL